MNCHKPSAGWQPKRVAALMLSLALAGLGVRAWHEGVADARIYFLVVGGVILGLLYTVRGGSLPPWVYRVGQSDWAGGTGITPDDDPRNLPPRLYLPILLFVIVAAAAAVYYYYPGRK